MVKNLVLEILVKIKRLISSLYPNPTGPLHVGHTRGAIFGDVLANLLSNVGLL